jgi:hypothetical protein
MSKDGERVLGAVTVLQHYCNTPVTLLHYSCDTPVTPLTLHPYAGA